MMHRKPDGSLHYTLTRPTRGATGFLRERRHSQSRCAYAIAEATYELESLTKERPEYLLTIGLEGPIALGEQARVVSEILERLISYTLLQDTTVTIEPQEETAGLEEGADREEDLRRTACLFSGGVDSLSGVLWAKAQYGRTIGIFCAHSHQTHAVSTVRALGAGVLAEQGIDCIELAAPGMTVSGYSQTRGFFYMVAGAAAAISRGAERLVVSECGPTMYQPRFAATDVVTMTTHPFVVGCAEKIVRLITGHGFEIKTPFEDRTKAEVIALCADKEALRATHSCISQRLGTHDGTCFGCVVRRLAAIAAGAPDTEYLRNPIEDEAASRGNLLALLEFSAGVLISRDELPGFQREGIDDYGKWDLFERFSLDNMAALYRLRCAGVRMTEAVKNIYDAVVRVLGVSRLSDRLAVLGGIARRAG